MKYLLLLKKLLNNGKLNFFFFLVVIFTLPLNRQLFTIALWPWLFTWIIEGKFREKFSSSNIKENRYSLIFLPGLYLLMLISIIMSSNKANGFNQLGIQSSLILFPVFISFSNKEYRKMGSTGKIFITYISGTVMISAFLVIKALIYSVSINGGQIIFDPTINVWDSVFFFSNFSYLIHPTYLGLMILFSAAICILDIKTEVCFKRKISLKVIISLFLYLIVFFISSKAVIIASLIIAVWLSIIVFYGKKFFIPIALFLSIIAFLLLSMHPRITRFIESNKKIDMASIEKVDIRIRIWKSSFSL
ncbi:MAG: hypothetical protein K8R35_01230, partial [Bacteroidales bacterium]|nr:hypothetical protein [Bacteroidales bacterium]